MPDIQPAQPARSAVVFERGGSARATSRDVATFFEKRHGDVLRAIDNLVSTAPAAQRNFAFSTYTDPTGRDLRHCDMDRDGFSLIAMGFTGRRAIEWKLSYISAFNAMEAEIRGRTAALPQTFAQALQLAADQARQIEDQRQELAIAGPKAEAHDRLAGVEGSLNITEAAKTLQVRPQSLFTYLRTMRWIYRRVGSQHEVAYQSKIEAGLLEHKSAVVERPDGSEKAVTQVRITTKGLNRLARELNAAQQGDLLQ